MYEAPSSIPSSNPQVNEAIIHMDSVSVCIFYKGKIQLLYHQEIVLIWLHHIDSD